MSLEKIYVVRHGFRGGWSVDPITGTYSSLYPSPTGIPVDPALTAHGIEQANELARRLMTVDTPIEAVYSSPYYRCLQTIRPFVELQQQQQRRLRGVAGSGGTCSDSKDTGAASDGARVRVGFDLDVGPVGAGVVSDGGGGGVKTAKTTKKTTAITTPTPTPTMKATTTIRPEYGLSEWFGSAPFEHPRPAAPATLKSMFPAWDSSYQTILHPPPRGETPAQLQQRVADTVQGIIRQCDSEGRRSVVLCTHAAVVIMLGRVLTSRIPESVDVDDFHAFTCGLSVYGRRRSAETRSTPASTANPVRGAWVCEANSDCSFLSQGAERGWRFVGDEDFPGTRSMSETSAHKL